MQPTTEREFSFDQLVELCSPGWMRLLISAILGTIISLSLFHVLHSHTHPLRKLRVEAYKSHILRVERMPPQETKTERLLRKTYRGAVLEMNAKGMRDPNGIMNNTFKTDSLANWVLSRNGWGWTDLGEEKQYLDCNGQSEFLKSKIENLHLKNWITVIDHEGGHSWIVEIPINLKNNQAVWMDPWGSSFSVGHPCVTCHGFEATTQDESIAMFFSKAKT